MASSSSSSTIVPEEVVGSPSSSAKERKAKAGLKNRQRATPDMFCDETSTLNLFIKIFNHPGTKLKACDDPQFEPQVSLPRSGRKVPNPAMFTSKLYDRSLSDMFKGNETSPLKIERTKAAPPNITTPVVEVSFQNLTALWQFLTTLHPSSFEEGQHQMFDTFYSQINVLEHFHMTAEKKDDTSFVPCTAPTLFAIFNNAFFEFNTPPKEIGDIGSIYLKQTSRICQQFLKVFQQKGDPGFYQALLTGIFTVKIKNVLYLKVPVLELVYQLVGDVMGDISRKLYICKDIFY
jgi:hypothetical protein